MNGMAPISGRWRYDLSVVSRFYVHNFRCLGNFNLEIKGQPSVLLIGQNGCGKSSVAFALRVLQRIARGVNRVGELVAPSDLAGGRTEAPMRFEIEAEIGGRSYAYALAFELPKGFKELRVREERLSAAGQTIYDRKEALVSLAKRGKSGDAEFRIDWHLVALPIIQQQSEDDPLRVFKQWLARMLILRPTPARIPGESAEGTLEPSEDVTNFAAWFTGLLAHTPSAYAKIDDYLKRVMPDFKDIQNPLVGKDSRSLEVHFAKESGSLRLAFDDLSDGEKCFMICAVVLAANQAYGPLLCFWDEPDNYLALSEVGHFVHDLRRAFQPGGQLIATSHNPEAIRSFSDENTFVLSRRSHLEPTVLRPLGEAGIEGDLVGALIRGDVRP